MPAVFHTVTNGVTRWDEDDINQLVNDLTGVAGHTKPHDHSQVNTTGWGADERNLDSTNGRTWRARRYDDVELASATKDGFRFSPDGIGSGIIPVGRSGDETIAGAKTFQDPRWAVGSNVAAAASIALPAAAVIVPITGTADITAFTGLIAGRAWRLQFASAGCTVRASGSVRIDGTYVSRQYGTLDIYSPDGTNVYESGRSGRNVGCRVYRTSDLAVADSSLGSDTAIAWQAASWNTGVIWAVGTPTRIVPGIGRWLITGSLGIDNWSDFDVRARVYLNGSHLTQLFHIRQNTGGGGEGFVPFSTVVETTAAADYIELTVSLSGASDSVEAGVTDTHLTLERVA